ncbi:ataxin-7-like protein 3 [Pollicipes pollicipes]|uniref:ataxin-7-like protein 3 n=1 Tax=Pollicipes pollicipes TaxID=41117 RepID=UPI00188506FD|nr:ataxin-7-like protein 3 [Pollicipes pollicipes]
MPDQTLKELDRIVRRVVRGETGFTLDQVVEAVAEILIDESTLAVCFDVHKAAKTGAMEAEGLDADEPGEFRIVETPGLDVLGQPEQMKRPPDAKCPVCARSIACTRFAPHLEKCVGLGRNSSRLASKRIASNQRETNYGLSEDEDEEEWAGERKKKKRDKLSPRRNKSGPQEWRRRQGLGHQVEPVQPVLVAVHARAGHPVRAADRGGAQGALQPVVFRSVCQCRTLPGAATHPHHSDGATCRQVCGVISESTRHMCTRSVRCQQHSDTQRRTVRTALFGDACELAPPCAEPLEEGALKDSLSKLWEKASRASSPADSTSTVASVGSTKRTKGKRGKAKKLKVHVSQPSSV